ncbi:hypothetical protein DOK78_001936 [Enterococcus sp. DIV2402]|uniref:N-acetyltransferase domain-containing protein n=1 Tax=Candidatus Enterococcus lowellii TaxID=2230877 RepID=A0ABZ2SP32_9ENTE|nr:GNAT family N-acetyltransferase [Enterococcus sp. DIV2402]MBO0463933.1 GNAT family N-acetyltransferase [Enterococcus sp. DIV2402]
MTILFSAYKQEHLKQMTDMWNAVLLDGNAFPGEEYYSKASFDNYLREQSLVTCVWLNGELAGFFVIHPNNIGRCAHVANASYVIDKKFRGKGIFNHMVGQSLIQSKELGFLGMQFNAVVSTNYAAIKTYINHGFEIVGTIRNGFRMKDNSFSNMYVMYRDLENKCS